MKIFHFIICVSLVTLFFTCSAEAQEKTTPNNSTTITPPVKSKAPTPLPGDLASFFTGEWEGVGAFSNGKEIKADVKFTPELDNQWLLYSHADQAPNKYKAMGMWGYERASGKFLMIVQDNFGGTRRFESDEWKDGKIAFVNKVTTDTSSYLERFTFEKQSDKSFKMTYEVNRNGNEWKLGDYLVFTRK